ncbi:MAG: hypothetical protein KAX49_19100 [Halanaerobiales bacterium]|nr:hypothetical protein [Halanaerobiales bacterium]
MLKSYIVKKYKIKKIKDLNYWYDIESVDELMNLSNVTGNIYKEKKTLKNPKHDFVKALKQLNQYDTMSDEMTDKLDFINNPLGEDKNTFIDLRYIHEDDMSENEFTKWFQDFIALRNWLENHQYIIEEVSGGDE